MGEQSQPRTDPAAVARPMRLGWLAACCRELGRQVGRQAGWALEQIPLLTCTFSARSAGFEPTTF